MTWYPEALESGDRWGWLPSGVAEEIARNLLVASPHGLPPPSPPPLTTAMAARTPPLVVSIYSALASLDSGLAAYALILSVASVGARASFLLVQSRSRAWVASAAAGLAFVGLGSALALGREEALRLTFELVFLVLLFDFAAAAGKDGGRWRRAAGLAITAALCAALSQGDSDWGLGVAAAAAPWAELGGARSESKGEGGKAEGGKDEKSCQRCVFFFLYPELTKRSCNERNRFSQRALILSPPPPPPFSLSFSLSLLQAREEDSGPTPRRECALRRLLPLVLRAARERRLFAETPPSRWHPWPCLAHGPQHRHRHRQWP